MSSHSVVLSSNAVMPCSPSGGRLIGHWRTTWSTVCSSAPHSQAAEEVMPHLYKQERKSPTLVRRRLNRTRLFWGGLIRGVGAHSIGNLPTAPYVCCCCQLNWWDVVQRVQIGVSIWGAGRLHSTAVMCPSHFCRVRVTSPSSQSHLKFCRVSSHYLVESESSHKNGRVTSSYWFKSSSQCRFIQISNFSYIFWQ